MQHGGVARDHKAQSGQDPQGLPGLKKRASLFARRGRFLSATVVLCGVALQNACTLEPREGEHLPTPHLPELEYIGQALFPPGYTFRGTRVGGLSGLDCVTNTGLCFAISDDLSVHAAARFYTLWIDLGDDRLDDGDLQFLDVTALLDKNGEVFAEQSVDPESIRFESESGTLYWSSEGRVDRGIAPFIREACINGAFVRELPLPKKFLPDRSGTRGIRQTLGPESLSLSAQGPELYAAMENALVQDGPAASLEQGSRARLLRFDSPASKPTETVYITDPVARDSAPPGAFMTAGLVEILALDSNRLLALERSFSRGTGFSARIYLVDLTQAEDVHMIESLENVVTKAVTKHLVLDLEALGVPLGNLEGLSFGPTLSDGSRSILLVADDNFNDRLSTRFLAFRLVGEYAIAAKSAVASGTDARQVPH